MGWYIGIVLGIVFIVYIAYNYNKIKNIEDVPPSGKIKILNNKNFKPVIRDGLVLVDFWAPWCAPCKMVAPTLNEIAEAHSDKITIAKVNVDQNQQISRKYNIRNIPTMILFEGGKEIKRITGVKPKKALLNEIGIIR
jgi:thioredoxin 1